MSKLRVPVMCLNAADDPVVGPQSLAGVLPTGKRAAEGPPLVALEVPLGGHCAFLGDSASPETFVERFLPAALRA